MNASPGAARGRGRRGARPGCQGNPGQALDTDVLGGGPGAGPGGGRYRRSVLETAILSCLAESNTHGYDLVEHIGDLASDLVCIDPGTMYRLLRALEEQGLVESSWQTPESGPSRRVYTITEQGVDALQLMSDSLALRAKATQRLADHAAQAAAKVREADTAPPAESR